MDNGGLWWRLWWNMVEYGKIWWIMVEYDGIWWDMGGIWVAYGG